MVKETGFFSTFPSHRHSTPASPLMVFTPLVPPTLDAASTATVPFAIAAVPAASSTAAKRAVLRSLSSPALPPPSPSPHPPSPGILTAPVDHRDGLVSAMEGSAAVADDLSFPDYYGAT